MTAIEKKHVLMGALRQWERWVDDGRKEYGYKDGQQLKYDTYHNHIGPLPDETEGTYGFSIQVYDSPDGDTWWTGKFRSINDGTDIEIIEEGSYST